MTHLSIDIETYSGVDIKKSGLYKYAESPDFEILLFAYSIDFGPVEIIDLASGEKLPEALIKALNDKEVIKHAYNAPFEYYCLKSAGYKTSIDQWHCTLLHGLYCGYTSGLGVTAQVLGLPQDKQKDTTGKALIKLFCCPCKPTKKNRGRTRNLPHHEPEKWELFKNYCIQDVSVEMEICTRLSQTPVPNQEQNLWILDQQINERGVGIDLNLVKGALSINDVATYELTQEAIKLTGLENPNSTAQLQKWLKERGTETDNLRKETVEELIKTTNDPIVKRLLKIRQELSKTSIKKYEAMKEVTGDNYKARGLLQFYGANRTGRWAGRLIQVQNLPRNYLGTLDLARNIIKEGNYNLLKFVYGNVPDTLSQLIRTAFIPSKDRKLIVADFSAIEARILAWLAKEQWRLEVFKTHGKIYEASASQMFHVPIEKIIKGNSEYELRAKGKVAELALGYQGSEGALKQMGALDMGIKENELKDIVSRWRGSNKNIVGYWYTLENVVKELINTGQPQYVNNLVFRREIDILYGQDFMTIELPSGRKLYYVKPSLQENKFGGQQLHYWGINQTSKKWEEQKSYGGKLVENVTQAIARDCLAVALKKLSHLDIVMHIHDEIVINAPLDINCEDIFKVMGEPIEWAPDLLLKADGFESSYYMKD